MHRAFCGSVVLALAYAQAGAAVEAREQRMARVESALLAPCCYTEPVARHQSEVALKMRLEIARLIDEGKNDDEILARYVREYGTKILVDPKTRPQPGASSRRGPLSPWAVISAAAIGLSGIIYAWRRRAVAAAPASTGDDALLPDLPED